MAGEGKGGGCSASGGGGRSRGEVSSLRQRGRARVGASFPPPNLPRWGRARVGAARRPAAHRQRKIQRSQCKPLMVQQRRKRRKLFSAEKIGIRWDLLTLPVHMCKRRGRDSNYPRNPREFRDSRRARCKKRCTRRDRSRPLACCTVLARPAGPDPVGRPCPGAVASRVMSHGSFPAMVRAAGG